MTYPPLAPGIDTDRLLLAIESVESRSGVNNLPRLEKAFMPAGLVITAQGREVVGTGVYFGDQMKQIWAFLPKPEQIGACCSWSPWQIMYPTAWGVGFRGRPSDLHLPGTAEPYVVRRLQKIAATGAKTVRDFADAWNSGSWRDANDVPQYCAEVKAAYIAHGGTV